MAPLQEEFFVPEQTDRAEESLPWAAPTRELDGTMTITQPQRIVMHGETVILKTKLTAEPLREGEHSASVKAEFSIKRSNGQVYQCGKIQSYTVDKTAANLKEHRYGRRREHPLLWVEKLLRSNFKSALKTEPIKAHANESDKISETQRCFMYLFDEDGNLRPEVWSNPSTQMLQSCSQIHYISEFEINDGFREYNGQGLPTAALTMYLFLLTKLDEEFRFEGPVILSPAPLYDVTETMVQSGLPVGTYKQNVEKLINSYGKAGFDVWREAADDDLPFAITMMGQVIDASFDPSIFPPTAMVTHYPSLSSSSTITVPAQPPPARQAPAAKAPRKHPIPAVARPLGKSSGLTQPDVNTPEPMEIDEPEASSSRLHERQTETTDVETENVVRTRPRLILHGPRRYQVKPKLKLTVRPRED